MTDARRTDELDGAAAEAPEAAVVEACEGPGKGARAVLRAGTLVVGSKSGGRDLVVADGAVSRAHVSLTLVRGGIRVKDLGSRNGTYYLGARITDMTVPLGARIQIGKTILQLLPEHTPVLSTRTELCGMIGRSPAMRLVFAQLERLAGSDAPVLIWGETGVGKQMVARALHELSPRAHMPFVIFDCAVSGELVESQLFGHVQGAFTGATHTHDGILARADGGTVLFSGVTDLSREVQPKLLRFLEERVIRPVGGAEFKKLDVRTLADASTDVAEAVKRGTFRADLYFRLAGSVVRVPPLRERPDDIPALIERFLGKRSRKSVPQALYATLLSRQWAGNVRELKSAVQSADLLGEEWLAQASLSPSRTTYKKARAHLLAHFDRSYWSSALEKTRGNIAAAARDAGLTRAGLHRLLKRLGLDPPREK